MSQHDETRRAFLKGAAVGAGALAGGGLGSEAFAKDNKDTKDNKEKEHPHKAVAAETTEPAPRQRKSGEGHGAFFNDEDAATVLAFAERLMPGAPGMAGARDQQILRSRIR